MLRLRRCDENKKDETIRGFCQKDRNEQQFENKQ